VGWVGMNEINFSTSRLTYRYYFPPLGVSAAAGLDPFVALALCLNAIGSGRRNLVSAVSAFSPTQIPNLAHRTDHRKTSDKDLSPLGKHGRDCNKTILYFK